MVSRLLTPEQNEILMNIGANVFKTLITTQTF